MRRAGACSGPVTNRTWASVGALTASISSSRAVAAWRARMARAWTSSPSPSGMPRSAVCAPSTRRRTAANAPASASGSGAVSRCSRWGRRADDRTEPESATPVIVSPASARMPRNSRARCVNRPAPISTPVVAEMMSSITWASSMTVRSCSGRMAPSLARSRPYRWRLTTTTSAWVARSRAASAKQRSPRGHRAAPGQSRDVVLTAAHAVSLGSTSSSARSPVTVVEAHAAMVASSSGSARSASPSSAS